MIFLTLFFLHNAIAIRPPCGLRGAGILCVNDEDCDGPHSVCLGGVCNCPSNFELFAIDNRTQVCRPAPSQVGAKCQSACRPPLVCQNNACVCWKADNVNGKCVINCPAGQVLVNQECRAAAAVAGKCEKDGDCIAAFTYCKGGLCDCVPGATRKGTDCVATCPDGSAPGAICRRNSSTMLTSITTARPRTLARKALIASLTANRKLDSVARCCVRTEQPICPNRARREQVETRNAQSSPLTIVKNSKPKVPSIDCVARDHAATPLRYTSTENAYPWVIGAILARNRNSARAVRVWLAIMDDAIASPISFKETTPFPLANRIVVWLWR